MGYRGRKRVSNNMDSFNLLILVLVLIIITISIFKKDLEIIIINLLLRQLQLGYTTQISIPGTVLKRDTKKQLEAKRIKFRRRAAIEPVIGHLKSDYRIARNYLKGFKGDEINLLLAASAFNLKKWMNIYFYALFIQDFTLVLIANQQINIVKLQIFRLLLVKIN
jgi:hypothetical protein